MTKKPIKKKTKKKQTKTVKKPTKPKARTTKKGPVKHSKKKPKKDDLIMSVKKETIKKSLGFGLVFAVILLIALSTKNQESVKLEFYVMSQCPYGTQVEDGIKPVLDEMGDAIDLSINFIAQDLGGGNFKSLHGEPEVKGNIVQLCAMKYAPKKYMDMVVCMNENYREIPDNWNVCAHGAGINTNAIERCYNGDEGKELLSASILKANAAGASASPTMFLEGEPYSGGRDALSFKRVICARIPSHSACKDIPICTQDADCPQKEGMIPKCLNPNEKNAECSYVDPVEVDMYVVNDKTCTSCDTSRIIGISKQLFPGAVVHEVEVSSEQGQELVDKMGLVYVPAYIFDSELIETNTWENQPNVRGAFETVDGLFRIKDSSTGANHFVDEELRAKFLAERGIVLNDNRPQVDFFVMSYCPYGNQAEEALSPVYDLLGDKADFNPRFVIYSNYQGGSPQYCVADGKYCSMHGIQELNQNVREDCAFQLFGAGAFFEFSTAMNKKCNSNNADTCWTAVAEDLDLNVQKISECEKNDGLSYVADEYKMTELFGVTGSPTVFVDGVRLPGGTNTDGYKKAVCDAFDEAPKECLTVLENTQEQVPSGQC